MSKIVIEHHGKPVNEYRPTAAQKQLVEVTYSVVTMALRSWPRASGKTVVRKMLAQVILDGDDD
jgi:hypothetical protein